MSIRKRYPEISLNAYLAKKAQPSIKQGIVLSRVVAKVWHLFVPALAVAAKDERFARIIVSTFVGKDRLFVNKCVAHADDPVRSQFDKKEDQEERRQKASLILFLYECQEKVLHSSI